MHERPLWAPEKQADRLAELTAGTEESSKELPLRRDVRSLGILLGRVLVAQAGQELFNLVEELRGLLTRHRESLASGKPSSRLKDQSLEQARRIIASLDVRTAYLVTKAFSSYFELTNLAESNHRKRRRRALKLGSGQ